MTNFICYSLVDKYLDCEITIDDFIGFTRQQCVEYALNYQKCLLDEGFLNNLNIEEANDFANSIINILRS